MHAEGIPDRLHRVRARAVRCHHALMPILKHMPDPVVRPVDVLPVHAVGLAHAPRQVSVRRRHQQVIVIRHLAPCMAAPVEPIAHPPEDIELGLAIVIAEIDRLTPVAPGCNVVQAAGQFHSKRSCHGSTLYPITLIARPDPFCTVTVDLRNRGQTMFFKAMFPPWVIARFAACGTLEIKYF